jgi:hypothetical protein
MEDYYLMLYQRPQKPWPVSLQQFKSHCYVMAANFFPYEEESADKKDLELRNTKKGFLLVTYYDLFKMRVQSRISNKVTLPLAYKLQVHYDSESLKYGEVRMENVFEVKSIIQPFLNPDLSRTVTEDHTDYGLVLTTSTEMRTLLALALTLNKGPAEYNAEIEKTFKETIEAIRDIYLYAELKHNSFANKGYKMLTKDNAKTPQLREMYRLAWNFPVELAAVNSYSDMPGFVKEKMKYLQDKHNIRVVL